MNISIALLTAVILHLTILALSIDLEKYPLLMKLILPIHFITIFLCLITATAYLYEEKLGLVQFDIYNISICFNNIPKYLLTISLILTSVTIWKSWIIALEFYEEIFKDKDTGE